MVLGATNPAVDAEVGAKMSVEDLVKRDSSRDIGEREGLGREAVALNTEGHGARLGYEILPVTLIT
ncbi:hypothetical protein RRF57_002396 [Xylaria bambusicola]|uniref:Uncharacterized protein n=1 Tax=Xylaria bambusicola TaxID=326684 RepID=A0AAN7UK85_9PEZI